MNLDNRYQAISVLSDHIYCIFLFSSVHLGFLLQNLPSSALLVLRFHSAHSTIHLMRHFIFISACTFHLHYCPAVSYLEWWKNPGSWWECIKVIITASDVSLSSEGSNFFEHAASCCYRNWIISLQCRKNLQEVFGSTDFCKCCPPYAKGISFINPLLIF